MKFRPADDPRQTHEGDPHPGGPVEWEDNHLSNTFAWASYRLTPGWCQTEDHWTSRLTRYLFTDCPCCLLFRGVVVGVVIGLALASAMGVGLVLGVLVAAA
ncbi:hypothetical protein [Bradyrhizobium sp. USDA 10063]